MPVLHIEHPITDLPTWAAAFAGFAAARREAGCRAERAHHPIDDARYVVVDLEFDTVEHATAFLRFLEARVWATREGSPALAGTPRTMILEAVPLAAGEALGEAAG
jgi:hypothetical protein